MGRGEAERGRGSRVGGEGVGFACGSEVEGYGGGGERGAKVGFRGP